MTLPFREKFAGESPYGAPQLNVPICLNVNENPYPPSSELIADITQAVASAAANLNRYPDRDFMELRTDLATYLAEESGVKLAPEQIFAANGSNEIMVELLQAFGGPGRTVVSFAPTYSMYPEYARNTESRWMAGRRTEDFDLDLTHVRELIARERPALILVASPNNPTGTALAQEDLVELLETTWNSGPGEDTASLVVVDEAYAEFRRDGVSSALELLDEYPHLVVTRTMSKAFGAAGLRLGYMAAARPIVEQVTIVRLPYHLSSLTQAAARAALAHRAKLSEQIRQIRAEREKLVRELAGLGLEVAQSDANFLMFGLFEDTHSVWQALLARGVLIREVGPRGFLRVSIGTPAENVAFLTALTEVLS